MYESPTPAFKGSPLGPALSVLSRPEIRRAEMLAESQRFDTRDCFVTGQPGDFAITAYGKERYPIRRSIFFGSYQVLGSVGRDLVAERLVHVRRAWEILGDEGTFDYGPGRGVVAIPRGSWLYQSDDDDFGIIHPSVKDESHLLVGPEEKEGARDWARKSENWSAVLGALPPVLTLLALGAFVAALQPDKAPAELPRVLIGIELALLLAGALMVWTMRRQRWFLRACVQTARSLGREFESAVVLLGQPLSQRFPGMSLWRAVQSSPDADRSVSEQEASQMEALRQALTRRLARLEHEIHETHQRERTAAVITLLAFTLVVAANISLLLGAHLVVIEFAVIWIPALVSAIHGFDLRRRTAERVSAMRELRDRLDFARQGLSAVGSSPGAERDALLRVVCSAAAQCNQRELRLALSFEAPLPI
jgi:hypothetical protein